MEITDTQTQPSRRLEPPAGGVHADGGGSEWILRREDQCAPILSILVGRVWRSRENVVPSIQTLTVSERCQDGAYGSRTLECWTRTGERRYTGEDFSGCSGILVLTVAN